MGVKKSARRIFETALLALPLNQMLDRKIVEKLFRDGQDKARPVRIAPEGRRQKERAVRR
jgi:hypothetical protein